ncbi:MAG: DALR anticodon-binding domain-containing protein, partial [Alphaproteobacteria bacterium]
VSAAVEQSKDNPVFYVQYAHARTRSLRHQVGKVWTDDQKIVNSQQLTDLSSLTVEDLEVVKQLALWPKILEAAALQREPHRLAFYLHDLAAAFNARWSMGREPGLRFILEDNFNLTAARLFLVEQVAVTLRAGLQLMGVVPLEELRDDTVRDNIGGGSRSGF